MRTTVFFFKPWLSCITIIFLWKLRSIGCSTCSTPECYSRYETINSFIDNSTDPCKEPYVFSCGKWIRSFELPENETEWSPSFSAVRNQTDYELRGLLESLGDSKKRNHHDAWDKFLNNYYGMCTTTESTDTQLISLLENKAPFLVSRIKDSGATIISGQFHVNVKSSDLAHRLSSLMTNFGVSGFLRITPLPSVLEPKGKYEIHLQEAGLSLAHHQYDEVDVMKHYNEYIVDLLATFTMSLKKLPETRFEKIRQDVQVRALNVLEIEQDIRRISLRPEEKRNVTLTTNRMPIKKVANMLKGALDLDILLEPFLEIIFGSKAGRETLNITVDNPLFFQNLTTLISSKWSWVAIHDYLLVQLLNSYSIDLSPNYRNLANRLKFILYGSKPAENWKKCLSDVNRDLGWVLSRLYLKSIKAPFRRKNIATKMIPAMLKAFETIISDAQWMDNSTMMNALLKIRNMRFKIGMPRWISGNSIRYFIEYDSIKNKFWNPLSAYYGSLPNRTFESFLELKLHMKQQRIRLSFKRVGKEKDLDEWSTLIQDVNARYCPYTNSVTIPLSILQSPFLYLWSNFDSNEEVGMKVLNFGALGVIIAHEIMHGFDDQGRQFGPQGQVINTLVASKFIFLWFQQLVDWWSPESATTFNKAAQCISDKYGKFGIRFFTPKPGDFMSNEDVFVSGLSTMGENIADNWGLKLAYMALKHHLSQMLREFFSTAPALSAIEIGSTGKYTPGQLFFLRFSQLWCKTYTEKRLRRVLVSDTHSPEPVRVTASLINNPDFINVFNCTGNNQFVAHKRLKETSETRFLSTNSNISNAVIALREPKKSEIVFPATSSNYEDRTIESQSPEKSNTSFSVMDSKLKGPAFLQRLAETFNHIFPLPNTNFNDSVTHQEVLKAYKILPAARSLMAALPTNISVSELFDPYRQLIVPPNSDDKPQCLLW